MNTITIAYMEDSFICANHPNQNYSKFAYLKVGSGDCEREVTKTLIKFNINEFKNIENAKKVLLELYVKNVIANSNSVEIAIYKNKNDFCEEHLTWDNTPNIEDEVGRFMVSVNDCNQYVHVDVTNLINDWIASERDNYGLTLISGSGFSEVTFSSSRAYNSPKLEVQNY